jgi:hypothetical protein
MLHMPHATDLVSTHRLAGCRLRLLRKLSLCGDALTVRYSGGDGIPDYRATYCFRSMSYDCHDGKDSDRHNLALPTTEQDWGAADTVVWGVGRHTAPASRADPRKFAGFGANDAAALQTHILNDMCNTSTQTGRARRAHVQAKLIWLDTLVRTAPPVGPNECPESLAKFHVEMPRALERACGAIPRVASIWDALLTLIQTEGSGWAEMTFDGVHWDMAANLLLADAVLEHMETLRN